jgi:predicted DNA-binding protein (UPF0251 family)
MTRPKLPRNIKGEPCCCCFKAQNNKKLEEILAKDELEALKLYEVDNLDQIRAAKKMGVSQPTFGRILKNAHKKVSLALVKGKTIRIS